MLDINNLIQGSGQLIGVLIVGFIVFAESGLLVGFFLPGDTLLFPAGFFAAQGKLPLIPLILVVIICAIAGDNTGYYIGHKTGRKIFRKKDSLFFRSEYLRRAEAFYEKHGGKTIILGRFMPIIRTFAPVVAGAAHMSRKRFIVYDAFGCIVWGAGIVLLGYFFGSKIPNIDQYIIPVILITSVLTFGPSIYHILKDEKIRKRIFSFFSRNKDQ